MKYRIRWENKNFDDMATLKCISLSQFLHCTQIDPRLLRPSCMKRTEATLPRVDVLLPLMHNDQMFLDQSD